MPVAATVRPPRYGPIIRQRRLSNWRGLYGCADNDSAITQKHQRANTTRRAHMRFLQGGPGRSRGLPATSTARPAAIHSASGPAALANQQRKDRTDKPKGNGENKHRSNPILGPIIVKDGPECTHARTD